MARLRKLGTVLCEGCDVEIRRNGGIGYGTSHETTDTGGAKVACWCIKCSKDGTMNRWARPSLKKAIEARRQRVTVRIER